MFIDARFSPKVQERRPDVKGIPMRDFVQLTQQLNVQFPVSRELWTRYRLEASPYQPCRFDWGESLAYHFDGGANFAAWLEIVEQVKSWVESRRRLKRIIKFVPFYEIGIDFFTQCKPPVNGGYHTGMYGEFLIHGSCRPAPWFHGQLAHLHERASEGRALLPADNRSEILSRVVHATFIKPNDHLYWLDRDGWAVYQPNVGVEDVRDWIGFQES